MMMIISPHQEKGESRKNIKLLDWVHALTPERWVENPYLYSPHQKTIFFLFPFHR